MVEVAVNKSPIYEQSVVRASPQYLVIEKNLEVFQQLYRYRMLDDVTDIYQLQDLLKMASVGEVQKMRRQLEEYIKFLFGGVFDRRLAVEQVCPSCFQRSLVDTAKSNGDEIKKACSECGFEITDDFTEDTFSEALDRAVTFQPSSALSYSGGKGCTFNPNSDREHKNLLWNIANGNNIIFEDFKKQFPEIASQFKAVDGEADIFELVWSGELGKVYCRTGSFIRMVSVDAYFKAVAPLFHGFDAPKRVQMMNLFIDPRDELRRVKEYGWKLCEKYRVASEDKDRARMRQEQTIYNTVGIEIERLKPIVNMRKHHVSTATFAETVFYIVVCRFDHEGLALRIKGELDIDLALVNFIKDVLSALDKDKVKPNYSPMFLAALEGRTKVRAIEA